MITLSGRAVSGGIAFGKVSVYKKDGAAVKRWHIEDENEEIKRYENAKRACIRELELLFYKAAKEIGETEAGIFEIHRMMLEDADFDESVRGIISKQRVNSEAAVLMTAQTMAKIFADTGDAYMQARAADIADASDRLIRILAGKQEEKIAQNGENLIIFADDLAPSETLQMDKTRIAAFVTRHGSTASHTAILARSMGIPAIIGVGGEWEKSDGAEVIADGYTGAVYINPTKDVVEELREKKRKKDAAAELLAEMKDKPTVTKDGKKIKLYANIGTPSDLAGAVLADAEGIGLFRSEFLYLESNNLPNEEEQLAAYRSVVSGMGDKPVIIRTLDVGADKKIDYLNMPHEENPALGLRAIRLCLLRRDIFKVQLRAILRASAYGNVMIMLPLITSIEEVLDAKAIINEAKSELAAENIDFCRDIPVGIMIETPAAAMISDILAEEVDFFSIGTNDLTQYVLAADRQNESIADVVKPRHKAILRLIEITVKNAHDAGIWVGICGELGADRELVPQLLKIGIDELSVVPGMVLEIRKIIRESNFRE